MILNTKFMIYGAKFMIYGAKFMILVMKYSPAGGLKGRNKALRL